MSGATPTVDLAWADSFYLLVVGCLVFFMQAGFAMLEAGSVRAKNTKNILLKNLLDACIGAIIWWAWGFGVAYSGSNAFIGTVSSGGGPSFFSKGWTGENENASGGDFAFWFFQYGFAAAGATIVSGAVAERAQLLAYLIYTVVITGWIYPVVVHWVWATGGFLSVFTEVEEDTVLGGCIDFAGSGVVHMTGGIAAFCGAAIIGPRLGRYDSNKKVQPMPGHSAVLSVLGTFILWLGWYGFNPGSTLAISNSGYAQTMARVIVTTTLSAAAGGVTTVLIDRLFVSKMWDIAMVCNGILGGLVSITAGAAVITPWYAFVVGIIGGGIYYGASKLMVNVLKIDDPLDAFAVHGACGFWGVFATGLFGDPIYTKAAYAWAAGQDLGDEWGGAFFGGSKVIGANFTALVIEVVWVAFWASLMFLALRFAGVLRVPPEIEAAGMDISKHGGMAYVTDGVFGGAPAALPKEEPPQKEEPVADPPVSASV
eukprot:CAMPEP_0119353324 /NCGR_PEP_ID=MMETSP1334-20130426/2501_1 /TAXON_ID=127549 /ORGANISM="Calcidiscus leptoporus, Strain RCC1130" /LENGTH=482 /DNA_ID=CAMNT_0007366583 /DNA_START=42 /DNA_END=1490 /DNA_ORIENTATION=+